MSMFLVEVPSMDQGPVMFPDDPVAWVNGLKALLAATKSIHLSASSTDWPGVFAVGFTTEPHSPQSIMGQMEAGKAFGFYVDPELARELSVLFAMMVPHKQLQVATGRLNQEPLTE